MQDRPFAFVCSPFRGDLEANAERARDYSRQVFDAGYTPLAPHLLFPQFLSEHNPAEREAGIQMGMEMLAGCKLLVVCGDAVTEGMAREIAQAERLGIDVQPLDRLAEHAPGRESQQAVMRVYLANKNVLGHDRDSIAAIPLYLASHDHDKIPGVWHSFPTTREALRAALDAIGADGECIAVQCETGVRELSCNLPYEPDLGELNYLAVRLGGLDAHERDVFSAVLLTCEYNGLKDMLNIIENLDRFQIDSHGRAWPEEGRRFQEVYRGPEDIPQEHRVTKKPSLLAALRSSQTEQTARDIPAKSREPEL